MMFSREHHKSVITVLNALATDYFQARQCYFGGGTLLALEFGEYRESADIDFLISDTEAIRALRAELRKDGYSVLFASTNSSIALNPQQPRVTRDKVLFAAQPHDTPIKVEILFEGRIALDNPRQLPFTEMPCLALRDAIAEKLLANADRGLDSAYFAKDLIDLAIAISDIELLESAMEKVHAAEKGYDVLAPLRRSVENFAAKQEFRRQCYAQLQASSPVDIVDGIDRLAGTMAADPAVTALSTHSLASSDMGMMGSRWRGASPRTRRCIKPWRRQEVKVAGQRPVSNCKHPMFRRARLNPPRALAHPFLSHKNKQNPRLIFATRKIRRLGRVVF